MPEMPDIKEMDYDQKVTFFFLAMQQIPDDEPGINLTGKKVGLLYEIIRAIITKEELDEFQSYISETTAVGPLFNPGAFVGGQAFEHLDMASDRLEALYKVLEVLEEESKDGD